MRYSDEQAETYRGVLLPGSILETALGPAVQSLGDLTYGVALDFGTGAGRSAVALRNSGAKYVVASIRTPRCCTLLCGSQELGTFR